MLTIGVKSWSVKHEEKGSVKICGSYAVKAGSTEVASGSFNEGYGNQTIEFPADLLASALKVDEQVTNAIRGYFEPKGS